jgi:multidrug efflux pump subunit AcrA (membrane-fusion protein)/YHS domain-containing protein
MRRRFVPAVLVLAAFVAVFQAGAWYQQRTAAAAATSGPRVLHYACPMHPAYTSDRPGTAPCCGMALEPVYATAAEAPEGAHGPLPPGAVPVTPWQRQLVGLEVQAVQPMAGGGTVRVPGRIAPDERRVYSLNAGLDGTVREVSAVTTGSRVRKGQVLGTYTAPDFLLAVQSFILALDGLDKIKAARAQDAVAGTDPAGGLPPIISKTESGLVVNSGSSNFQQRIDRLHLLGMSDAQIDEIRRMRDVPASIKMVAPADGIVLARKVSPGWKFMRGEEWFRVADLRRVWIVADVPGLEAQRVRPGQSVRVHVPDLGRTLEARVSDTPPQFDAQVRTFKLRLETDNPGELLRPDMFVEIDLPVASGDALAVPVDAVVDTGRSKTVYVESGEGVFEPRDVVTGWRHGDAVQIVRGLTAGERVVTSGTFLLDSESRMRRAPARAAHPAAAHDPVCGMSVAIDDARNAGRVVDRDGALHYFCSMQCRDQFAGAGAAAPSGRAHGSRP